VWVQQGQTWKFHGQKYARNFDVSISVLVAHAEDRFISLTRTVGVRSAHDAPDQREVRHLNIWIESGTALQPSDLFDSGTAWEEALRRHVREQVAGFFLNQAAITQALDPDQLVCRTRRLDDRYQPPPFRVGGCPCRHPLA